MPNEDFVMMAAETPTDETVMMSPEEAAELKNAKRRHYDDFDDDDDDYDDEDYDEDYDDFDDDFDDEDEEYFDDGELVNMDLTLDILNALGFEWPEADEEYLIKFIEHLNEVHYFD